MGDATPAADSAVHGELAQANLLRLRGDLKGSEKALLAILRRFPNDPHAHEMLGDVCADAEENERAIEWYELALDLSPSSSDVRRKLDEARKRLDARETSDTAEVLGLPPSTPPAAWWPLAAAGGLLVLAILVAAWPRPAPPTPLRATVVAPAPATLTASNADTTPVVTPPVVVSPPPSTTPAGAEEDRLLLADIQKRAGEVRIQNVSLDPRSGNVAVDFEVAETDDAKTLALTLGKEALLAASSAPTVTLRALRAGRVVFAADLARTALDQPEPLSNVWPTPATSGETVPPSSTTASSASGSVAPPSQPPTTTGTP